MVSCCCLLLIGGISAQSTGVQVLSPDKKVEVLFSISKTGEPGYQVRYSGKPLLAQSRLGLVRDDGDFSTAMSLNSTSPVQKIGDVYHMVHGKRKQNNYQANRRIIHLKNASGKPFDIIFQVSNDGLAFRYYNAGTTTTRQQVLREVTEYRFDAGARAWLQPMQVSKTGWEKTNPAYEEHYQQDIPVGTPSPTGVGWVYPALFRQNDTWLLITEAGLDSSYCASRLSSESAGGTYSVAFPDPREVIKNASLLPVSQLPFYSPWRVITLGGLNTIIESALGTDLAKPSVVTETSFVKPGKSSWSWIMSKDDSIVYSEQKRYVDFASRMKWQYCLVDADWDRKIGYDRIKELSEYAAGKNVGLLLWYNSAGDWNTVKYTPKNKLLTHADRVKEFTRLNELGIKGVKIDFFGGDGQSVIGYYLDILQDAAAHKLMVNFHGATLPRGWSRTYPNLVTTEAVRGFEMITFNQADADSAASHCAMLPFTRNAFDPMDFTPMNLYRIPTQVKRKTTSGFELALSVLFLSGIQHFAESPAGMEHVPDFVQTFLQELPDTWDDVKFLTGFPGKNVVLARKAGNRWYIAGINAEKENRNMQVDLTQFKKSKATLFTDSGDNQLFKQTSISLSNPKQTVAVLPAGGFVMVLE
ncbi:glycoside hydrolase family 97 protein [Segetibacter sp. 3557_3]|nr:glycoside hydrolase family 97 protein [Segetibacter sp. 3557_3]